VIVASATNAPRERSHALIAAGCEVLACDGTTHAARMLSLLDELGRRKWTNILVEGGGTLLGSLFDAGEIDEVHAFIAPQIIGGREAARSTLANTLAALLCTQEPFIVAESVLSY
jgi:diaminohydroxyphosphoribosylaminopyrimidine deaminase/5-amino-6-(5-phosphoribosylamino)uracil reductase